MVAAVLIVFAVEVSLDEFYAERGRVGTPRPERCPACGHGGVTFAGWWTKQTRRGPVGVHRVLCASKPCGTTHSCWPDVLVGGRVDPAGVIGAALEVKAAGWGHRRAAERLGVPEGTVRGWLRRFALVASAVARALAAATAAADPVVRAPPEADAFQVAVAWVRLAGAALHSLSGQPVDRWGFAVMVTCGRLLAPPAGVASAAA